MSLQVLDGYAHRSGALRVRVLGLPVQTQTGHDVDVGEAYRYLAELPWVPHAMAMNPELEWREVDDHSVDVFTAVGNDRPTVRMAFNDAGDVVRCFAEARPLGLDGSSVPTRWGGDLSAYGTLGGMRMPTRGEVYWDLPEGRFVYWRGEITSAEVLEEPFGQA